MIFEVSCEQVMFTGSDRSCNVVSFKDISTKEMLDIQVERTQALKNQQEAMSQYLVTPINGIIQFSDKLVQSGATMDKQ